MPPARVVTGPLLVLLALALLVAPAAATIMIAAADAPADVRSTADLVCDGVDDQLEINRAFDALPWDGGTVRLSEGTFRCTDNLVPGPYTTLEGAGTEKTTIAISGYYHAIKVDRPHVTLRQFRITDRAWVRITASHVRVEDVLAEDDLHGYYPGTTRDMGANGAFFVWAENRVVEDILFYRCVARDVGTHGFNLNGAGSPRLTRNIRFIECEAVRCGDAEGHPWAAGFDLHESNDLVDLTVERCYAADNWESGFHFEPNYRQEQITLVDCVSEENGWRNTNLGDFTVTPAIPAHFYMAGYTVARGTVLINCRSVHNRNYGFYQEQGGATTFISCSDVRSGYGWKVCKNFNDVTLIDCTVVDPGSWALWAAAGSRLQVNSFHQYNAPGRTDVTPRVQSMLGWYKGEVKYEKPVTDSFFEITAHGSSDLPILNLDDQYNGANCNNVYELHGSNETAALPPVTPLPRETPPPVADVTPVPLATPEFPAVHGVPGRIEAENYLPGRESGFSDTTAGNEGAVYRFDDVDIEYAAAISSHNLGYIRPGEWVAYDLEAREGCRYTAAFRLATPFPGRSFLVLVDDVEVGRVNVPSTGSYETYASVVLPVDLSAGVHRLRLVFDHSDHVNLDRIDLVADGSPSVSATPTTASPGSPVVHTLPGRFPAGAFASAGPDVTADGEALRAPAANWVRYLVIVPAPGIYAITLESSVGTGGTAVVETAGVIGGAVPLPAGGPSDTTGFGFLPAGPLNLTLRFDTAVSYRAVAVVSPETATPTAVSTPTTVPSVPTPTVTPTITPTPLPASTQTPNSTPTTPSISPTADPTGSPATPATPDVTPGATATPGPTAPGTPAEGPWLQDVPGGAGLPGKTMGGPWCDDVNGNGRSDFADVVLYFNQMAWIAANEPVECFDYNGNGRVDFADVVWLFNRL